MIVHYRDGLVRRLVNRIETLKLSGHEPTFIELTHVEYAAIISSPEAQRFITMVPISARDSRVLSSTDFKKYQIEPEDRAYTYSWETPRYVPGPSPWEPKFMGLDMVAVPDGWRIKQ
jgi:hypothetical protein